MAKTAKISSYVAVIEVKTTSKDRSVLRSRLEAGRQLYNAVLGEALRRLAKIRRDTAFAVAKAMPHGATGRDATAEQKAQASARQAAFRDMRKKYGFREYSLHKHPSLAVDCWLRGHLDIHAAQKIATRAFKAAERYAFGQAGRPRFKRYGELASVEGKSNTSGIRYRSGSILWNGTFAKLELPLIVKPNDQVQAYVLKEADAGRAKYVRLLSRTIRGEERVYAQLVMEGLPGTKLDAKGDIKHPVATGTIGMDLGPSKVAVVAEGKVESIAFCVDLDRKQKALRRYRRRMDRQRRTNNPDNYNPNGTIKPGRLIWRCSGRQNQTKTRMVETHRVLAAQRKSLLGEAAHHVLSLGDQIVAEKVNKREWAKDYGRGIAHKAPGTFEARIATLAKASGGSATFVSTYKTFLSSRCLCGLRKKKTRSERKHFCGCDSVPVGTFVDRNEFSAFLAMFCQGGVLDIERARCAWKLWGADCLLRSMSNPYEIASGEATPPRRARASVIRLNPAIRDRVKSGHREWHKT